MWDIGEKLSTGLRAVFEEKGVKAIIQNVGPMLQIMFTERKVIRDYREFCAFVDRDKYKRFALSLFSYGVYMSPSAALHSIATLAHTEDDVVFTLQAIRKALNNVKI